MFDARRSSRSACLASVFAAAAAMAAAAGPLAAQPARSADAPIFTYHSGFWLSLHQFLYVLGRAEAKAPDARRRAVAGAPADQADGLARMSSPSARTWQAVVHEYSTGPSTLDAVFDERLIAAGEALARAGSDASLDGAGVDREIRALLERAAPIYRATWWPAHEAANRARIAQLDSLVRRHGGAILAYVTHAYGQPWPAAGYPVQVTPYANWAGAFSTGNRHLVVSSLDPGLAGALGLETIFHEAMHQWDDVVQQKLRDAARASGAELDRNLSHAMVFYTAGEAVRSVIPGHETYAESRGFWTSIYANLKPRLDAAWKPHLDGQGTLDSAIEALFAK